MLEKNVGMIDRIFRAAFGVVFIAFGVLYLSSYWMIAALFVGMVLIFTAFAASCPAYSLLGISTIGSPICDLPGKEEKPPVEVAAGEKPKKKTRKRKK